MSHSKGKCLFFLKQHVTKKKNCQKIQTGWFPWQPTRIIGILWRITVALLIFMIERSFKVPFRTLWKFYHLECLNQLSWLFGYHGNRKTMRNSHYFAFLTLLPCSFVNMHDRKTIQSFFSKTLGVLPSRVLKLVFMFTWLPW